MFYYFIFNIENYNQTKVRVFYLFYRVTRNVSDYRDSMVFKCAVHFLGTPGYENYKSKTIQYCQYKYIKIMYKTIITGIILHIYFIVCRQNLLDVCTRKCITDWTVFTGSV